jgi:hypothetical protein
MVRYASARCVNSSPCFFSKEEKRLATALGISFSSCRMKKVQVRERCALDLALFQRGVRCPGASCVNQQPQKERVRVAAPYFLHTRALLWKQCPLGRSEPGVYNGLAGVNRQRLQVLKAPARTDVFGLVFVVGRISQAQAVQTPSFARQGGNDNLAEWWQLAREPSQITAAVFVVELIQRVQEKDQWAI